MAGIPLASAFVRVEPDVAVGEFAAAGKEAGAVAGKAYAEGFSRDSQGRLRQANGRFATDEQKRMLGVGDESGKSFGKGFNRSVKKSVDDKSSSSVFGRVAKIAASKFALIGLGATAATPGVIHLTAALLPAAGALAALPVAISAVGVASATMKVATAGVGKAITTGLAGPSEQADKAMAAVPPAAQAFAKSIIALKSPIDALKQSVAQNFFAPLQDQAAATANVYLPLLKARMSELAAPLGGLGAAFVETARKAVVMGAVSKLFGSTTTAVGILRRAVDPLVTSFANLISSTAPRLPGMAQGFVNVANAIGQWVSKAAASGRVNAIIDAAIATLKDLGGIAVNVGSILGSVFRAAAAGSGSLLGNFKLLTGQVADFLKSAQGMGALQSVFAVLAQLGGALRTSLGAVLPAVAKSLQTLGPAIGALAGPASQLIVALAPLLPSLAGIAALLIRQLTPAISVFADFLAKHNAVVKDAAFLIGAYLAVQKVTAGFIAVNAAGGLVSYIKQMEIAKNATKVWTGIQIAFNAVMALNPFVLVTLLIAGLVAGMIIAYKHSETFRNIVNGAWSGIKTAIKATVDWITGTVWPSLKGAWDQIAGAAKWLWHTIFEPAWHGIQTVVEGAVGGVKAAIGGLTTGYQAVATAAKWLWHNVFEPVWHGIQTVVSVAVGVIKAVVGTVAGVFRAVAGVATWLWHTIFGPVFGALTKIVQIWWLAVEIVFKALSNIIGGAVRGAINLLRSIWNAAFAYISAIIRAWWGNVQSVFHAVSGFISGFVRGALTVLRNLWNDAFNYISGKIQVWWGRVKAAFDLFRTYVIGPVQAALTNMRNFFSRLFGAVAATVSQWWTLHVRPVLSAVSTAWGGLASAFSNIYNGRIRPVFSAFVGFIRNNVVGGFTAGVNAIKTAWAKVQEYARKPVEFVVNHVINPFINGMNAAAAVVGVKDRVSTIKFADGGLVPNSVPGYASGGRITGAPSSTDNRLAPARIPGVGSVKLAGGEFVVNASDTAKALPLLKWINAGMKTGGARGAAARIGRPMADMPGDGSEGWAFASGGLIGWAKDVWGAIADPIGTLKKPFESLLGQIPGAGMIKDFLVGSAKKLLNGAVGWLKSFAGSIGGGGSWNGVIAPGQVGVVQKFIKAQAGKPYGWANAGPRSYDCSGIVSAAFNMLHGKNPYSHTFGTASLPGPWFNESKKVGPLVGAWSHPGQRPASAGTGHMMGSIGGMTFESTGSKGVHIGGTTRRLTDFRHMGVARSSGGLIPGLPVKLFDSGGLWPSGTLGANMSGHPEHVLTGGPTGDIATLIAEQRRTNALLSGLAPDIADALERPTRRAVRLGRGHGVATGRA
jgi:phage-related protein